MLLDGLSRLVRLEKIKVKMDGMRGDLDKTQSALTTHKVELALARRELVEEEHGKRGALEAAQRSETRLEVTNKELSSMQCVCELGKWLNIGQCTVCDTPKRLFFKMLWRNF